MYDFDLVHVEGITTFENGRLFEIFGFVTNKIKKLR